MLKSLPLFLVKYSVHGFDIRFIAMLRKMHSETGPFVGGPHSPVSPRFE